MVDLDHEDKELRQMGLKATGPRMKILNILATDVKRHLSAEEIHNTLKRAHQEVGLATVYRVLTQFEQAGLVRRHRFSDDYNVFELEQDEHHDHMLCIKCGHVQEFVDEIIEQRQLIAAQQAGFHITDHSLHIYGICHHCQEKT